MTNLNKLIENTKEAVACILVGAIYVIALSLIQSNLQTIFQTALYYYAKNNKAPKGFKTASLSGAMYQR